MSYEELLYDEMLNERLMYEEIIDDVSETTADTRAKLSNKTDKELMEFLMDVDYSIRSGFNYASYYQEWSVGTDILRMRGYGCMSPKELKEFYDSKYGGR